MKNLIITLGILLLMTMGIVYEHDMMTAARSQRQLKWICHEMADAAAETLRKEPDLTAAEQAAEEILQKNTEQEMEWKLEKQGNTVIVKVVTGQIPLRLSFLDRRIILSYQAEKEI